MSENAKPYGYHDTFNDVLYRGPLAANEAYKAIEGGNTVVTLFTAPPSQEADKHHIVTDDMITAYLTANDAYWKDVDQLPINPSKWRNGTPRQATKVSLEAALAAINQQKGEGK